MVAGVGICGLRCFSSRLFAFYDGQAWNDGVGTALVVLMTGFEDLT